MDPTTRPYFDRPFRVLKADRIVDALLAAVTDPTIAALPRVGAIDQFADNTDLLTDRHSSRAVAQAALSPEVSSGALSPAAAAVVIESLAIRSRQ